MELHLFQNFVGVGTEIQVLFKELSAPVGKNLFCTFVRFLLGQEGHVGPLLVVETGLGAALLVHGQVPAIQAKGYAGRGRFENVVLLLLSLVEVEKALPGRL